ncbi:hypothetical protein BKP35_09025 [Anaerobacillus arseniciselenatis]|uniref:Uncharacterized protein n=1 Tax=Anaerobacillus arseniciselenatis TaxID=85682 RepID=A0A1S2LNX2_9BACI|nr:hypothetical protein [Anaerobacillus arseniciselenatis]OIJ13367.1 hypothetical protein BKP35_09025 [Anaerobacillus arseniciselenatis]
MSWKIATLSKPTDEIIKLLMALGYKYILELLLILRKNPNEIKDPLPFLEKLMENLQEFQKNITP